MWTGRRFLLKAKILAIEVRGSERVAEYIPTGETVTVVAGPKPTAVRLVDVKWKDREMSVFFTDLQSRSEPIEGSPGPNGQNDNSSSN
jgi:hypothetical protein